MEWQGNGASLFPDEEPRIESASSVRNFSTVYPNQELPSSHLGDSTMASLCQNQQRCVKASIVSNWRLAEAQDQLCALGVHSSESLEQERARTSACPTELTHIEQEWRRKESMLGGPEPSRSPVLGTVGSWDVFDKSIINIHDQDVETNQDECETFLQKYEQDLRHFGMLRRWDDSQRCLSDKPELICEETANYLILWCIKLQQEGKEALMDQVAHQAVAMQFILEMASNSQQDPRGCFRQFFQKAKEGQDAYLQVFHTEFEAFKHRVKEYLVHPKSDAPKVSEQQHRRLDTKDVQDSLTSVAEYPVKRCLEVGLWTNAGRWTKEDATETDDMRMMETS